jgi:hypothetical protein
MASHRSHIRKRERQKRRFKRFKRPLVIADAPIKTDLVPRPSTFDLVTTPGPSMRLVLDQLNPT